VIFGLGVVQVLPIYIAAFIWAGLWLHEPRVRAVFPIL
jgi:hypothetical protein